MTSNIKKTACKGRSYSQQERIFNKLSVAIAAQYGQ